MSEKLMEIKDLQTEANSWWSKFVYGLGKTT